MKKLSTNLKQHLKKFAKLVVISCVLSACGGLPKVTLHQLDLRHKTANPFKITKYNEKTCKLEIEEREPYKIFSSQSPLHGAFCVSAKDAAELKATMETNCKNARDERNR